MPVEVVPRPAATVLALRRTGNPFEVLMVRRAREAKFMGGARVFPGGGVDPADSGPVAAAVVGWSGDVDELPWRAAALRELAEEVGILISDGVAEVSGASGADLYRVLQEASIVLDGDALCYVSNWVTPRGLPKRFDTRFYVVEVPPDAEARPDRGEVYDPIWVAPRDALAAADAGAWQVEIPTRVHLEMLAAAADLDEVLRAARRTTPIRVEPRLSVDDAGAWSALLPGDPGYLEASP